MTGLWIALGIFAFFFLIFIIPIHVMVGLTDNVSVMVRVLFLKIPSQSCDWSWLRTRRICQDCIY